MQVNLYMMDIDDSAEEDVFPGHNFSFPKVRRSRCSYYQTQQSERRRQCRYTTLLVATGKVNLLQASISICDVRIKLSHHPSTMLTSLSFSTFNYVLLAAEVYPSHQFRPIFDNKMSKSFFYPPPRVKPVAGAVAEPIRRQ